MVANSIYADSDRHRGPTPMHSSSGTSESLIELNKRIVERLSSVNCRLNDEEKKASKTLISANKLMSKAEDLDESRKSLGHKI